MADITCSTPRCQAVPKQKLESPQSNADCLKEEIYKSDSVEQDALAERLANTFEEAIAAVGNGEYLLWLLRSAGKH
jgi:hypothetical protein